MKYQVLRAHQGDKPYIEGDERIADPAKVAHLVDAGVLKEKAAPASKNKAARKPANKATGDRKTKPAAEEG